MVVIAMLSGRIQAAVGCAGRVRKLCSLPWEPGQPPREVLSALFAENALPRNRVVVLLPREAVTTRLLTLPPLPPRAMAEAVDHALWEEEPLVTDFLPLGSAGKLRRVLAVGCPKQVLERYEELFSGLNARIGRISVPRESLSKLMQAEKIQGMLLSFDGGTVETVFPDGDGSRHTLYAQPGTEDFALRVGEILQEESLRRGALGQVVYTGCRELPDLDIPAMLLKSKRFASLPGGEDFGDWAYVLGGLL